MTLQICSFKIAQSLMFREVVSLLFLHNEFLLTSDITPDEKIEKLKHLADNFTLNAFAVLTFVYTNYISFFSSASRSVALLSCSPEINISNNLVLGLMAIFIINLLGWKTFFSRNRPDSFFFFFFFLQEENI